MYMHGVCVCALERHVHRHTCRPEINLRCYSSGTVYLDFILYFIIYYSGGRSSSLVFFFDTGPCTATWSWLIRPGWLVLPPWSKNYKFMPLCLTFVVGAEIEHTFLWCLQQTFS